MDSTYSRRTSTVIFFSNQKRKRNETIITSSAFFNSKRIALAHSCKTVSVVELFGTCRLYGSLAQALALVPLALRCLKGRRTPRKPLPVGPASSAKYVATHWHLRKVRCCPSSVSNNCSILAIQSPGFVSIKQFGVMAQRGRARG